MGFDAEGFDREVPLPPDLKISHVRKAIEYIEREATEVLEVYFEQANVFSGLVGIFGVRALHSLSPYKKHKHPDVAQQRFPDMSLGGKLNPPPEQALESKGTTRPWTLQSHYNHAGWYIVWRYLVDPPRSSRPENQWLSGGSTLPSFARRTGSTKEARRAKAGVAEPIRSASSTLQIVSRPPWFIAIPRSFYVKANRPLPMVRRAP